MLHNVYHSDCYVQHLTKISERTTITIEKDVCNDQGAVIIPKGRELSCDLAKRLRKHHLNQPIEHCITLERMLTSQELMDAYKRYILKSEDARIFHERWQLNSLLSKACDYCDKFPLIMQKITVLKLQMPHLFHQAMFSAYISLAIARRLKANIEECTSIFLAGLVHDIGILHLDPNLVTKREEYTPDQWRAMQSHCEIGSKFLSTVPDLPKAIVKAVAEHHERYDGSGYPNAKEGKDLCTMGQVIGMADTCLALYTRDVKNKKLGLDALLPILQLNPGIYCHKVFKATIGLIREIPWPEKRVYSDDSMPGLVSRLLVENEAIVHDYSVLYGVVVSIDPHLPNCKKSDMLRNMTERIHRCLNRSGILQREHCQWIKSQNKEDYVAIERLEIMYTEIKWQMKQLKKLLFTLWQMHQLKYPKLNQQVQKGLWQIEQYHRNHETAAVH